MSFEKTINWLNEENNKEKLEKLKESLILELRNIGAIKNGEFVLKSGEISNLYFNIKDAQGYPQAVKLIGEILKIIVPQDTTCFVVEGGGGTAFSMFLTQLFNLPVCIIPTKKSHGSGEEVNSYRPTKDDVICIVDDVFTKGTAITSIKDTLTRLFDVSPKYSCVIVDRSNDSGNNVISGLRSEDISL